MNLFKKSLTWFDDYGMVVIASFLLAFIPLYPKLPLFEAIPGYIVRVRLEDLLIFVALMIWGVQLIRKKICWKTPLTYMLLAYAVVGFLSILSAVFITKTVPFEILHIGKTALHYFRYLEYFSLFFILYSAIKNTKHTVIALVVMMATLTAVSIYGIGQKYYYWPVYSTMNREFSKGIRLYLTEHARVQSTFGGHYDLGAYLVIVLPVVLTTFFFVNKKKHKLLVGSIFLLGLWLLTVTAARTSFASFALAAVILLILTGLYKFTPSKKRLWWISSRSAGLLVITFMMLSFFGDDMSERLMQVVNANRLTHDVFHETNRHRKDFLNYLTQNYLVKILPNYQNMQPKVPDNAISVEDAAVLVASDERPSPIRPSDVYVNVPVIETVATQSADGTITETQIETERTYSDNAMMFGLSFAIRLDTLWPRALQGFYANPLLGTGYATLTKESIQQFTEAESTDNNFLRTLGETGLLGFITFYGVLGLSLASAWRIYRAKPNNHVLIIFAIAYLAGSIGLLLNAIFIDVFAASKVAFTLWALAGIILAIETNLLHTSTSQTRSLPNARSNSAFPQFTQNQTKRQRAVIRSNKDRKRRANKKKTP